MSTTCRQTTTRHFAITILLVEQGLSNLLHQQFPINSLQVSGQNYRMKGGLRTVATRWVITGKVDVSRLGKEVIEFCRGMEIYEVEEYAKDGAKVLKGKLISYGSIFQLRTY